MTAQEARKLADAITSEAEKAELKSIEEKIKLSAQNGNLSMGMAGGFSTSVEAELKRRGFKVQTINDRDGNWTTISW